ncbi:MAG: hypothetical protein ACO1N0_00355 [Fluviicola sp.]
MKLGATEILLLLIFLGGFVVLFVFYLKNLQDLLRECGSAQQQVPPGNVWLMFIPFFNYVYGFILYLKISETLKREFEYRNAPQSGDYLKALGIVLPSLNAVGAIPIQKPLIVSAVIGLGGLVVFIIYWVQAANMKNKLRALPKGEGAFVISDKPDLLD